MSTKRFILEHSQHIYNCIIVDDDDIDRLTTQLFCQQHPSLKITGSFTNGTEALEFAKQNSVDVVFLDIDMPDINGINLKKQLDFIPVCIFITSHAEFALESFELSVLDFIVKPITTDRFAKAMLRAENYLSIRYKANLLDHTLGGDALFINQCLAYRTIWPGGRRADDLIVGGIGTADAQPGDGDRLPGAHVLVSKRG